MPASLFLPMLPPDLVASVADGNFKLQPRTRPILSPKGVLAVRLVWRRRDTGASVVITWTLRGEIGDELFDALDAAMHPPSAADRQSPEAVSLG
jgi:hypothetical protein